MNRENYSPEALSKLSREYLRGMLAAELRKEPAQLNGERIRALRQELARRGPDPALEDDAAVEAACGKFLAETSGTRPIRKRICRSFLAVAASLLLLTALFFALPKAAEANDIKNVIGWWNDSVFRFVKPGETPIEEEYVFKTDHPGLQQIYDAVADLGVTVPVVPTDLSKEYELTELKVYHMNGKVAITACLANGLNKYLISIVVHNDSDNLRLEKSTERVSVWDFAGIEHAVMFNTENCSVSWIIDRIECTVVTNCKEDVYNLIKSIYTSEV